VKPPRALGPAGRVVRESRTPGRQEAKQPCIDMLCRRQQPTRVCDQGFPNFTRVCWGFRGRLLPGGESARGATLHSCHFLGGENEVSLEIRDGWLRGSGPPPQGSRTQHLTLHDCLLLSEGKGTPGARTSGVAGPPSRPGGSRQARHDRRPSARRGGGSEQGQLGGGPPRRETAVAAGVAARKSARTLVLLGTLDVRQARRAVLGKWKASGMESTALILSAQASENQALSVQGPGGPRT
jgi:hypothetical protein